MLMPVGLKGKERDKYIKENAFNVRGPQKTRTPPLGDYPGLKQPGTPKQDKRADAGSGR